MNKPLVLAVSALLLSTQVDAATTASVGLGPLTVGLADLDSGDAVAPSFQWGSEWILNAFAFDRAQTGWSVQSWAGGDVLMSDWAAAQNASLGLLNPAQLAFTSPSGVAQTQAVANASGLQGLSTKLVLQAGQQSVAQTFFDRDFTLGANTQVTFSVLVDAAMANAGYLGNWTAPAGLVNVDWHSSAATEAAMWVGVPEDQFHSKEAKTLSEQNRWETGGAYDVHMDGEVLSITLQNATGQDAQYHLRVGAWAYGLESTLPAAVPEPASYALMVLGLLGVAGATRRRRA